MGGGEKAILGKYCNRAPIHRYSLALCCRRLGLVVAEEELAVEELDPDHGEDEEEEQVDDQDVKHVPGAYCYFYRCDKLCSHVF